MAPLSDDEFVSHRFERRGGIPCLTVELPLPAGSDAPLEIRGVDSDAALADHVRVVAEAFDGRRVSSRGYFVATCSAARWHGFVGYVDGEPAGAAQLVVTDRVAGVYYVATTEPMRRRGIGEAITRHALVADASRGCSLGSLQASPMGRPIYERMGFEVVSEYRTYVPAGT